jgi:hypothetical protein
MMQFYFPYSAPTPKKSKQSFRPDEDNRLTNLVRKCGPHNWNVIASQMPDRTARQCRDRWQVYLCPSVNRTPWTPDEDKLLLAKCRDIGGKWSIICQYFHHRTLNNVKNRWYTVVRKVRALGLDETSDSDWLACARLITGTRPLVSTDSPGDSNSALPDPLSVFQISRLLNNPVQSSGTDSVCRIQFMK